MVQLSSVDGGGPTGRSARHRVVVERGKTDNRKLHPFVTHQVDAAYVGAAWVFAAFLALWFMAVRAALLYLGA